ncbi:MAG: divergent PAP2 family protein [Erysipelothrix sp.]|nr:divergent PAP2 family protein [Erysipelothrix sp.]
MRTFYPLISALVANMLAQILKPLFHYLRTGEQKFGLLAESGGFPSSHTSMVVGLTTAIGLQEGINSTLFFISIIFSLITIYDAANVRYYAGQNIAMTKQLIKDIETLTQHKFSDPIYLMKIKTVLGHKWVEVFGGIVLGILIPSLLFLFIKD